MLHPKYKTNLVILPPETAARSQFSFTTSWCGHDGGAAWADNDVLGVAEDGSDLVAAAAFDVHETRVGALYEPLLFMFLLFSGLGGVAEVDS